MECPKYLYIYRSFDDKKIECLGDRSLEVETWKKEVFEGRVMPTCPLYFNDPYDCDFCIDQKTLQSKFAKSTIIENLKPIFEKLKIETITEKEIENLHNSSNTEETVEEILKTRGCNLKMPLLDVFCNGLKSKIDDLKKGLTVVCFTEDVKSILMWSHYANNHRGFCIEYKLAQTDLSKQIRKVIYSSERHYLRDEDLNEKGIFRPTLYKSDVWKYEKEWRYVTANFPWVISKNEKRFSMDFSKYISGIYLGTNTPEDKEKEVIKFCFKKNIPVYKMKMKYDTYALEPQKIDN